MATKDQGMQIPEKLAEKRITRKELCDAVDVPYPTMSQYFGGYNCMPDDVYAKVIEFIENFTI